MKHLPLICLSLAVLLSVGCNESVPILCGNGQLDVGEVCDGDLLAQNIQFTCVNGVVGKKSALKCNMFCQLDLTEACVSECGNNIIEPGEFCDGTNIPQILATCADADYSKISCSDQCRIVDNGICPEMARNDQLIETCGNGKLDEGEICDGSFFRDNAKVCPDNMVLRDESKFACLPSCRLIDVSNACAPEMACGNGKLDKSEQCDGTLFDDAALASISCPDGKSLDSSKITCGDNCLFDTAQACVSDKFVLITEVVPALEETETSISIGGLAIEMTNMGKAPLSMQGCGLNLYGYDGTFIKSYDLNSLGIQDMPVGEPVVVCSQRSDHFNHICHAEITSDLIQENIASAGFLALTCDGNYVDIFNINSFIAAVNNGAVDFMRQCDQNPVTDPADAYLGEGWAITALKDDAPMFGLGNHCDTDGLSVDYCSYTISRNTLTDRSQSIEQTLDIRISGITDKTSKTDSSPSIAIRFITGSVSEQGEVSPMNIHYIWAHPDTAWTDDAGIDRYVGTLNNYDTYEGFIGGDEGTYVMDAAISFDNEKTWVYCGPQGIVDHYDVFDEHKRNRLDVVYDETECGDGIIAGSEVCDGVLFLEEALVCETEGQVVADRSKLACYGCEMMSTAMACADIPQTCHNGSLDEGEACDGDIVPDTLRVCPENMVPKQNPIFVCNEACSGIDTKEACEAACGNGRLDEGEICDGELYNQDAVVQACGDEADFDISRYACSACTLSRAACVPKTHFVVDEYLVKVDTEGKPQAVSFVLNNYGTESIDVANCTLSFINKDNRIVSNGNSEAYAYAMFTLPQIKGEFESETVMVPPCEPIVICSEPTSSEETYSKVFGECDATLVLPDGDNTYIDNILVTLADEIDRIQLTCLGQYIDFFDFSGMIEAVKQGNVHGRLKSTDKNPWPDRMTVTLENRMDLDQEFNLENYAKPVCE